MAIHLKVLFHLHDKLDALDFVGPLEMLSHVKNSDGSQVFSCTIASAFEVTTTNQGARVVRDIDIATAHESLSTFDIFIVPGGSAPPVLSSKVEPLGLIKAFSELPAGKIHRTLLSICTGSLFVASQGVLKGLTATTHWGSMDILRSIVKDLEVKEESAGVSRTTVVEDRFVVNPVNEKKGLRVITSGGISCGLDATLWLIEDIAGKAAREKCEKVTQYKWRGDEGLVVGQ
jgi:transcriptional regulator GlxA family with amidase domain